MLFYKSLAPSNSPTYPGCVISQTAELATISSSAKIDNAETLNIRNHVEADVNQFFCARPAASLGARVSMVCLGTRPVVPTTERARNEARVAEGRAEHMARHDERKTDGVIMQMSVNVNAGLQH